MGSKGFLGFLLIVIVLCCFMSLTQSYKFHVGGKDGWVVTPSENYNHWAERNRFQVNDTLFFKYKKGADSVLLVTREDYFSCNTTNPILSLKDGDSTFTFDRSGPFFFISGISDNCNKGQKLIVVVMAVRHKHSPSPSTSPATPPVPSSPSPPTTNPPVESPEPSDAPSDLDAPAPVPSQQQKSGSVGLVCSTWLVLGFSTWVSVVTLGSY